MEYDIADNFPDSEPFYATGVDNVGEIPGYFGSSIYYSVLKRQQNFC